MAPESLIRSIEKATENLQVGACAGPLPRWIQRSLVGAGLSLALVACGTTKHESRATAPPTSNLYAGPPVMGPVPVPHEPPPAPIKKEEKDPPVEERPASQEIPMGR